SIPPLVLPPPPQSPTLPYTTLFRSQPGKIGDHPGSKRVSTGDIEEKLRELGIVIRIDSFIDPQTIRRVTGVVREMYADKGYQFAEVTPEIKEVAGGPKLVHLTFNVDEGPKVKIRDVDFVGNEAFSDEIGRAHV